MLPLERAIKGLHRDYTLIFRSSDAIALAIGNKVPIDVSEELLQNVGIRIDDVGKSKKRKAKNPIALYETLAVVGARSNHGTCYHPPMRILRLLSAAAIASAVLIGSTQAAAQTLLHYTALDTNGLFSVLSDGTQKTQLLTTGARWDVAVDDVNKHLYFTLASTITRSDFDGSNVTVAVTGANASGARGVAVDPLGGKLYWARSATGGIWRSNLDGSVQEMLVGNLVFGQSVRLDLLNKKIYFADISGNDIRRANLDGSNQEFVHQNTCGSAQGAAPDPIGGKVYFVCFSPYSIERSDFDGGNREVLVTPGDGSSPRMISLDIPNQRMYWAENASGELHGADFDGGNVTLVSTDSGLFGVGIPAFNVICGDGKQEGPEGCDDGNTQGGDGCSAICQPEFCGNSIVDPGEACDDGNTMGGDGCSADCNSDETCGNGIVDPGEGCDDGNTTDGDGCQANCALPICGDGFLDPGEICDDGNMVSGDGCDATCGSDETCGNGILDTSAGEACDDGNTTDGDGCEADCSLVSCGDSVVQDGETCDDGNNTDGDGCNATCTSDETCGNGVVDDGEFCDQGMDNSADGPCGTDCQLVQGGTGGSDTTSTGSGTNGGNTAEGGCRCTTAGKDAPSQAWLLLALAGLAGLRRRR